MKYIIVILLGLIVFIIIVFIIIYYFIFDCFNFFLKMEYSYVKVLKGM